jgi:hypothetical protein
MSSLYREHHEYHERRLEQQHLDALLRIEEVLGGLLNQLTLQAIRLEEAEEKPKGKRRGG